MYFGIGIAIFVLSGVLGCYLDVTNKMQRRSGFWLLGGLSGVLGMSIMMLELLK